MGRRKAAHSFSRSGRRDRRRRTVRAARRWGRVLPLPLPLPARVLLPIDDVVAGLLVALAAHARSRDRARIVAVEELEAAGILVDPGRARAVGQDEDLRAVRVLVLRREPDRLLGWKAVARPTMGKEAAIVIGP